ncbi:DNA cytosine methyltransferase [Arhodomonas sp. AD133]|uniref:DNA cytosine methyltransferase n=1 Tax=Arhodomonas sp. AD133 TaxID=3415009 RepID=UPI003EC03B06
MGLRYLSVCSGIEAATVAWHPLGWTPLAFSEVEPFPSAVLAHHYPEVPNWGDMTRFEEWPNADIDVLAGGTPCQSFSVAGLRRGLDDPRGNLTLTYLAIAERYSPRWVVWENVPGVLSSDDGRAFGALLGGLEELGYGWAYRTLDAQYFGVAQRRRRVFVVGHFGDWRPAAAVLFEPDSLRRNSAPRREAGQGSAPTFSARTRGGGGLGTDTECDGGLIPETSPALKARDYKGPSSDGDGDGAPILPCITGDKTHALTGEGFDAGEDGTGRGTRVRRLTPRECERLQGFPDDYTLIPTGKARKVEADMLVYLLRTYPDMSEHEAQRLAKDGPRYKALGNSWAVPVAEWIGRRIDACDSLELKEAA